MAAPKYDNNTNILSNIAEVYGLDQLITEYTRIADKSDSNRSNHLYKYSR